LTGGTKGFTCIIQDRTLALEYELRFARLEDYRARVWVELCNAFFQRFILKDGTILDLGCGWGEFINAIQAGKKYGMDLNPESPRFDIVPFSNVHETR
jgi:hypothetical protein